MSKKHENAYATTRINASLRNPPTVIKMLYGGSIVSANVRVAIFINDNSELDAKIATCRGFLKVNILEKG